MARSRLGLLASALLLSACFTSMQMSPQESKGADPDHGTIVGSLQIKGGRDILGRTRWELDAPGPGLFGCTTLRFDLRVEDASAPTLEQARQASAIGPEEVARDLMTIEPECGNE
jgi:hypothetical protein